MAEESDGISVSVYILLTCEAPSLYYLCVGILATGGKDLEREPFSVPAGTGTLNINHIAFENGLVALSCSQESYRILVF